MSATQSPAATDILNPTRDMLLAHLTGRTRGTPYPKAISNPGEGGKFTPEGAVLSFPGNTFLCHVKQDSDAFAALCEMRRDLLDLPTARHFTYLPSESFHMTVFCGVSGHPLGDDGWPRSIAPGASLADITEIWSGQIASVEGFSEVCVTAETLVAGYSLQLVPGDAQSAQKLHETRARLRRYTGVWREAHDSYVFHISLGYQTKWMTEEDAQAHIAASEEIAERYLNRLSRINLGAVEFCVFENMHHFEPIAHLPAGS